MAFRKTGYKILRRLVDSGILDACRRSHFCNSYLSPYLALCPFLKNVSTSRVCHVLLHNIGSVLHLTVKGLDGRDVGLVVLSNEQIA